MLQYTSKKIVLIDDDKNFRDTALQISKKHSFQLDAFESLKDLGYVSLLQNYEVAIIDYFIDDVNGFDIASYIDSFIHGVSVILISNSLPEDNSKNWPVCVKRFLHKSHGVGNILKEARKLTTQNQPQNKLKTEPCQRHDP